MQDFQGKPLSLLARWREAGEDRYTRALEAIARFALRRKTPLLIALAVVLLPALLLPTFNLGAMCALSAFFQVLAVWLMFQIAIAWLSYFALQSVNVWPFWVMVFLHVFSTGVALDKMRLEKMYCDNIRAIRLIQESRAAASS
jgi:hypothetical protein